MLVDEAIYGILWCGCNILFALDHIQGLINNIHTNFIVTMLITIHQLELPHLLQALDLVQALPPPPTHRRCKVFVLAQSRQTPVTKL